MRRSSMFCRTTRHAVERSLAGGGVKRLKDTTAFPPAASLRNTNSLRKNSGCKGRILLFSYDIFAAGMERAEQSPRTCSGEFPCITGNAPLPTRRRRLFLWRNTDRNLFADNRRGCRKKVGFDLRDEGLYSLRRWRRRRHAKP